MTRSFPAGSYVTCYTNRTNITPYARTTGTGGEPGPCGFGPPSHGATYYWKVRAIDDTGDIQGIFSELNATDTWRFIYIGDLPTLLTPADNSTVQTPTFTWTAVDNIERYRITIKDSGGATVHTAVTYATSYTPPALLDEADEPFQWYVTTIDGLGHASVTPSSGDWFHFSLDPITTDTSFDITSPADGASSARMPKMTWDPYTGADHYKVFYGPSGGLYFVTPLSGATELKYAGFTYSALPLSAGTYKYYVEAYNAADTPLAQSAEQTFTVTAPLQLGSLDYSSPPRCTLIATCTTLADTPTIEWEPVAGAGAYEVTLANDAEFTNEIKRYKTIFTTLTPRESFLDQQAGQAIYWFVKPCVDYSLTRCGPNAQTNANDNASAFRKNSAAIEVLTPTAGQTIANQITFNWTAYLTTNQALNPAVDQEARSYRIEVSTVRRLRVDLRRGDRRPDDLHAVQQDLPGRPALLAGPGDRRQRQHADEESGSPCEQGLARAVADVPWQREHPVRRAVLPVESAGIRGDVSHRDLQERRPAVLAGQQGPEHDNEVLGLGADDLAAVRRLRLARPTQ